MVWRGCAATQRRRCLAAAAECRSCSCLAPAHSRHAQHTLWQHRTRKSKLVCHPLATRRSASPLSCRTWRGASELLPAAAAAAPHGAAGAERCPSASPCPQLPQPPGLPGGHRQRRGVHSNPGPTLMPYGTPVLPPAGGRRSSEAAPRLGSGLGYRTALATLGAVERWNSESCRPAAAGERCPESVRGQPMVSSSCRMRRGPTAAAPPQPGGPASCLGRPAASCAGQTRPPGRPAGAASRDSSREAGEESSSQHIQQWQALAILRCALPAASTRQRQPPAPPQAAAAARRRPPPAAPPG